MIKEAITSNVDYKLLAEQEKKSRLDNDIPTSAKLACDILRYVWRQFGVDSVAAVFLSISKKRNQSKRSHTDMIKVLLDEIYPTIDDVENKEVLLKAIIEITEGKIYVEFEFSVAVKKLTEILLLKGEVEEAAKLIQDIQIETFGSLERKYKVDYILFQMKVLLSKGDFVRTHIVSNKVIRKHLNELGLEALKVEYYLLMIKYYNHEEKYFELSICYKELYDFMIQLENKSKELCDKGESTSDLNKEYTRVISLLNGKELFEQYVIFLNICPPKHDIALSLGHLNDNYKKELETYPLLGQLIKIKLGEELVAANSSFFDVYSRMLPFIDNNDFFNNGKLNMKLFRKYFIQHNLRIISKFFSQISLRRISELIEIDKEEAESEICDMVSNDYLYARINRIKSFVAFRKKQTGDDKLNNLDNDLSRMLETLESTCHLIHKENLKFDIK